MTDTPQPELIVDRFQRALLARASRPDRLTPAIVAAAFTAAGLDDVPLCMRSDIINFVVGRWEAQRVRQAIQLSAWTPTPEEIARPH